MPFSSNTFKTPLFATQCSFYTNCNCLDTQNQLLQLVYHYLLPVLRLCFPKKQYFLIYVHINNGTKVFSSEKNEMYCTYIKHCLGLLPSPKIECNHQKIHKSGKASQWNYEIVSDFFVCFYKNVFWSCWVRTAGKSRLPSSTWIIMRRKPLALSPWQLSV